MSRGGVDQASVRSNEDELPAVEVCEVEFDAPLVSQSSSQVDRKAGVSTPPGQIVLPGTPAAASQAHYAMGCQFEHHVGELVIGRQMFAKNSLSGLAMLLVLGAHLHSETALCKTDSSTSCRSIRILLALFHCKQGTFMHNMPLDCFCRV